MMAGDDLYRLVVGYSDLGEHRTGTDVDAATVEWLAERLSRIGGRIERQPYEFDRFDAVWEVAIDGEASQSIPLFYEGIGTVSTNNLATLFWEPGFSNTGSDATFEAFARQALDNGYSAAVVATGGPSGLLHAVNRRPALGSGLPTLLVPGALGDQLAGADIKVKIRAEIVPGWSSNVLAWFGEGSLDETVVITTPISGWFRCAGERGTGIAVALDSVERLKADIPLLFIGTTGHELHHLGAHKVIAELDDVPKAIIHIGASIAAAEAPPVDGEADLTKGLRARLEADPERINMVTRALAEVGIQTTTPADPHDPDEWLGESKNWAFLNRPMLSLAGGFYLFHAPEDIPERATTPALLERSSTAIHAAIEALIR
jgi:hypothetical protein